jgi:hypothetical protein
MRFKCCYIFLVLQDHLAALLSIQNWVPFKPVLEGWKMTRFHYPSCTGSIKQSLQFSCDYVVINAAKRSSDFQSSKLIIVTRISINFIVEK